MAITFLYTSPQGAESYVVVNDAYNATLVAPNGAGTEVPQGPLTRDWLLRYLVPHVQLSSQATLVRDRCTAAAYGLGQLELLPA